MFIIVSLLTLSIISETSGTENNLIVSNFENFSGKIEVSVNCRQQLQQYHEAVQRREIWALQMLDAGAKFHSGLLEGNFYDLGQYNECLKVSSNGINGRYCLGTLHVTFNELKELIVNSSTIVGECNSDVNCQKLYLGRCIPDICNVNDLNILFTPMKFDEKYCYAKNSLPKIDAGAIATIAIFGLIVILVILSTSYDIFLHYTGILVGWEPSLYFSILKHRKELMSTSQNENHLNFLKGMRAVSMIWILLYQEYILGTIEIFAELFDYKKFLDNPANMFFVSGDLGVDTFLLISGVSVVYGFFYNNRRKNNFNIFYFYMHKYVRLTSVLAIIILFQATLLKHLGNGPLWNTVDVLTIPCKSYWWSALLHVQNYVHDEHLCVPQSWYASVEMQLFLLTPLILYFLKKYSYCTLIFLGILIIPGVITSFVLSYKMQFVGYIITQSPKYLTDYYIQTYCRYNSFLIGMIVGYLIYKIKSGELKVKLTTLSAIILWMICVIGMLVCIYAGNDAILAKTNKLSHSSYISLNRLSWVILVGGIIFVCSAGYGGPISLFLSAPIFQILSKLTYNIYMVHLQLIFIRRISSKANVFVDLSTIFFNFWGDMMYSLIIAIILFFTVESPMISISDYFYPKRRK